MRFSRNELTYGQPTKASGAVGMTRMKNLLKKVDPDLVVSLRNNRLNGVLEGCRGFVSTPDGRAHVYLSVDANGYRGPTFCFRTADSTKDFSGGRNNFAQDEYELAIDAVALLREQAAVAV